MVIFLGSFKSDWSMTSTDYLNYCSWSTTSRNQMCVCAFTHRRILIQTQS
jgi:hypothetical protein